MFGLGSVIRPREKEAIRRLSIKFAFEEQKHRRTQENQERVDKRLRRKARERERERAAAREEREIAAAREDIERAAAREERNKDREDRNKDRDRSILERATYVLIASASSLFLTWTLCK